MRVVCCLLLFVACLSVVVCWLLLFVVCCLLCVDNCLMFVVCCVLLSVCCLLFVCCGVLCVLWFVRVVYRLDDFVGWLSVVCHLLFVL